MSHIRPILYITDEPSTHPTITIDRTVSGKQFPFAFEPDFTFERKGRKMKGAHVRRYEDLDKFRAEQFDVLVSQSRWKIFSDVEIHVGDNDDAAQIELERLESTVEALEEAQGKLTAKVLMADGALQSKNAEILDLQIQVQKLTELLDAAAAPATAPPGDTTPVTESAPAEVQALVPVTTTESTQEGVAAGE